MQTDPHAGLHCERFLGVVDCRCDGRKVCCGLPPFEEVTGVSEKVSDDYDDDCSIIILLFFF